MQIGIHFCNNPRRKEKAQNGGKGGKEKGKGKEKEKGKAKGAICQRKGILPVERVFSASGKFLFSDKGRVR